MEFYISGEFADHESVSRVLCNECILANVYPMTSIVQDVNTYFGKASKVCKVEQGAKVQVFCIENNALLDLWAVLREALEIHCIWLDYGDYHGCICQWDYYLQTCANDGVAPLKCSEYD